MFSIFISNPEEEEGKCISSSLDWYQMVVRVCMCRAAIQRDHHSEGPGQAGEMAWQQPYKIQPGQTQRLHLEQTNPLQWYGLRTGRLAGLQLCWKGLKESRGKWTKCGEQYSLTLMKASSVLACVNKSIAVDQAKWLFLFTSHFLDNMCNAVSNTLMQEGCCCRQRAIKMTGNCSTWLVRRRWENWALLCLEKRKLWGRCNSNFPMPMRRSLRRGS